MNNLRVETNRENLQGIYARLNALIGILEESEHYKYILGTEEKQK